MPVGAQALVQELARLSEEEKQGDGLERGGSPWRLSCRCTPLWTTLSPSRCPTESKSETETKSWQTGARLKTVRAGAARAPSLDLSSLSASTPASERTALQPHRGSPAGEGERGREGETKRGEEDRASTVDRRRGTAHKSSHDSQSSSADVSTAPRPLLADSVPPPPPPLEPNLAPPQASSPTDTPSEGVPTSTGSQDADAPVLNEVGLESVDEGSEPVRKGEPSRPRVGFEKVVDEGGGTDDGGGGCCG